MQCLAFNTNDAGNLSWVPGYPHRPDIAAWSRNIFGHLGRISSSQPLGFRSKSKVQLGQGPVVGVLRRRPQDPFKVGAVVVLLYLLGHGAIITFRVLPENVFRFRLFCCLDLDVIKHMICDVRVSRTECVFGVLDQARIPERPLRGEAGRALESLSGAGESVSGRTMICSECRRGVCQCDLHVSFLAFFSAMST